MKRSLFVAGLALATLGASCPLRTDRIGRAEMYWLMNRACWTGDEIGVEMLLKAGADPDGVRDYKAFHQSRYQIGLEPSWPINMAADGGHAEIIRLLLRAGANPHAPEDAGQTALTIAAARGHLEVVRLLLQAGVDKAYLGPMGTAEETARRSGHEEVADAIRRFPGK